MAAIYRYSLLQAFAEHRQALMRFLRHRLGNPALAEEFAHETWLRIASRPGGVVTGSPRSHLFRIAANLAFDYQRRAPVADPQPRPKNVVLYRSEFARLVRAIDGLPSRCREIFLLCRFESLSHADIAERLGISRNSVVSHMVNAMAKVEREMDSPR